MTATLDVLAIAAHPDDAELGCGGTLAKLARLGRRVGILDLTRGELGSRGTPEGRRIEAESAARILGLHARVNAELPDGGLDPFDAKQRLVVARILREMRPRILLAPWTDVRHPDHAHATRLVEEAMFRAGLHKLDAGGAPFRPNGILYYMERPPFQPTLIVDVTADYDRKRNAIAAHRSQFFADDATAEPQTFISRPEFLLALEARDRYHGDLIGATWGEPFLARAPLALIDPATLWEEAAS